MSRFAQVWIIDSSIPTLEATADTVDPRGPKGK